MPCKLASIFLGYVGIGQERIETVTKTVERARREDSFGLACSFAGYACLYAHFLNDPPKGHQQAALSSSPFTRKPAAFAEHVAATARLVRSQEGLKRRALETPLQHGCKARS
jgi:hypothetical protein